MEEDKIIRKFIIKILSEYQSNELEGKGYDFYFSLRHELDVINKELEGR